MIEAFEKLKPFRLSKPYFLTRRRWVLGIFMFSLYLAKMLYSVTSVSELFSVLSVVRIYFARRETNYFLTRR